MTYPLVRDLAAEGIPVRLICGVLGFSTQAFYKWCARPVCDRDLHDAYLANAIVDAHRDDPEFGYRFLADELERAGHQVGERRVWRLCNEHRIWSTTAKKGRIGKGRPGPAVHDDLVERNFTADHPDQIWLTDITEHPTSEGKIYCCAIKDLFSNRIVGYSIDDRMTAQLAVGAIARRQPRRHRRRSQRSWEPVSVPGLPHRPHHQRAHRVDGPCRRRWRQRGDGIVLRALAEERAEPPPMANTRRASLRDRSVDRAHLQPSAPPTRPRPTHTSRVRTRLHTTRRSRGMISLNHRQPKLQQTRLLKRPSFLTSTWISSPGCRRQYRFGGSSGAR